MDMHATIYSNKFAHDNIISCLPGSRTLSWAIIDKKPWEIVLVRGFEARGKHGGRCNYREVILHPGLLSLKGTPCPCINLKIS